MFVYVITNLVNNKVYIGQHSGYNLDKYLSYKISSARGGKTSCPKLYRAFNKYGRENFTIQALSEHEDKSSLDKAERFAILVFRTQSEDIGYNISDGGEGSPGATRSPEQRAAISRGLLGKKKSPEHLESLRKSGCWDLGPRTDETKSKISQTSTGRSLSADHVAKLRKPKSESHRANMRKPKSPEHILAISVAQRKRLASK